MKAHIRRFVGLGVLAAAVAASPSCTALQRQGEGNSFLIIDRLSASAGGSEDEDETTLQSDVETNGSVFEDVGAVVFRLALKDPGTPTTPNSPTLNNFITINRYRVTYSRTDGRNQPGVHVPFPFEGAFTVTVRGEGTTEASFVLVRPAAKWEAPLRALRGLGGAVILTNIAEVTFYGQDQTGREVSVTGRIQVDFADWGDPDDGD